MILKNSCKIFSFFPLVLSKFLVVFPVIVLLSVSGNGGDARGAVSVSVSCQSPRLAEVGWTDISATTALATLLMEGLGHTPKVKLLSIPVTFASLKNNDMDIFLGNWQPSMRQDIAPYLKDGSVESKIINLQGAKYTLAVPKYVYDGGVKSFADLAIHKDKFAGKIYGIEPGNDGNRIIQELIAKNHFGLKDWSLVESSEQGMLTQVMKLVQRKKWIVFLGWAPHPMNNKISMEYLEGGDKFFGANKGESTVYTVVRKNYHSECPNLGILLKNLIFNVAMENTLMQEILENKISPQEAAKKWLVKNPDILQAWLAGVKTVEGKDGLQAVKKYLQKI